jgi:hypothetical protein
VRFAKNLGHVQWTRTWRFLSRSATALTQCLKDNGYVFSPEAAAAAVAASRAASEAILEKMRAGRRKSRLYQSVRLFVTPDGLNVNATWDGGVGRRNGRRFVAYMGADEVQRALDASLVESADRRRPASRFSPAR